MDVVIRLGVRIEMHWPLFSVGTLQLNSSQLRPISLLPASNLHSSPKLIEFYCNNATNLHHLTSHCSMPCCLQHGDRKVTRSGLTSVTDRQTDRPRYSVGKTT